MSTQAPDSVLSTGGPRAFFITETQRGYSATASEHPAQSRKGREAFPRRRITEQLYRSIYIKWKQNEAMSDPSELSWAFDRLAKNRFILGSPDECIEQIKEYETRLGMTYMLVRFDWTPGLPQEEILASMRLFGEKVIQRL